jgi:hypothetical protein
MNELGGLLTRLDYNAEMSSSSIPGEISHENARGKRDHTPTFDFMACSKAFIMRLRYLSERIILEKAVENRIHI